MITEPCVLYCAMNISILTFTANAIARYFLLTWGYVMARYMGTITGISDLDPVRWLNSHWRSVKVCCELLMIWIIMMTLTYSNLNCCKVCP